MNSSPPLIHATRAQIESYVAWCIRKSEIARKRRNPRVAAHLTNAAQIARSGGEASFYAGAPGGRL
jgi:hypothetical protein